jgi:hypothetical protein
MLKRERTADEKKIDKLTKSAIMHLGAQPSKEAAQPNPFPYVMFWSTIEGRKGQRCRIVTPARTRSLSPLKHVEIEFEDGYRDRVNRMALRQAEASCSSSW